MFQQIRAQVSAEYEEKFAKLERRLMNRLPALDQNEVISPGVRHSSCASGIDGLDLIEIPTPCDLVRFIDDFAVTVAKGMVYPSPKGDETVHHAKLQLNNVKVHVDLVLEGFGLIPLPVPNDEMGCLRQALNGFVQWPKIGVILDKSRRNDQGTTKAIESWRNDQVTTKAIEVEVKKSEVKKSDRGKEVSNDERPPSPDRPLVEEEEWRRLPPDLITLHTRLMEAPEEQKSIVVEVPRGEFYHAGGPILVHFRDIKLLLKCGWLDISILTVFSMHMSKLCSTMEHNLCAFLDPARIAEISLDMAPNQAVDYICDALLRSQAQNKPYVLAPVYQRSLDYTLVVFVMDPDQPDPKKAKLNGQSYKIMNYYKQAFMRYISKGGPHNTELKNKLSWSWLMCHQQHLGWECGYYVMKYMYSFVTVHQKTFPKNFPAPGIAPYLMADS